MTAHRRGFTLIELLVVIAVIAVLVALLLPAVQQAREAARRSQCRNNLKQVALSLQNYESAHTTFPMGSSKPGTASCGGAWGFQIHLMPYLEATTAYDTVDFESQNCCHEIIGLQNAVPAKPDPASFVYEFLTCPSDPNVKRRLQNGTPGACPCGNLYPASYLGVAGDRESAAPCSAIYNGNGILYSQSSVRPKDVTDGTSNTFIIGERGIPQDLIWGWVLCGGQECEQYISTHRGLSPGQSASWMTGIVERFWSWHPGGVHFAMADGSVQFLSYNADVRTVKALSTRAGDELAGQY